MYAAAASVAPSPEPSRPEPTAESAVTASTPKHHGESTTRATSDPPRPTVGSRYCNHIPIGKSKWYERRVAKPGTATQARHVGNSTRLQRRTGSPDRCRGSRSLTRVVVRPRPRSNDRTTPKRGPAHRPRPSPPGNTRLDRRVMDGDLIGEVVDPSGDRAHRVALTPFRDRPLWRVTEPPRSPGPRAQAAPR